MSQNKTEKSVFFFLPCLLVCVNVFDDSRFSSFFMVIGGLKWGLCIEMHVLCKAQELLLIDNGLSENGRCLNLCVCEREGLW